MFGLVLSCSPKDQHIQNEALVYETIHQDNVEIYQGDVLGKWERKLTNNPYDDLTPHWNPGLEKLIYYAKDSLGELSVMSLDLDSKVTSSMVTDYLDNFILSPDGKRVFYTQTEGQNQHIWSCDLDGKNQIQLTKGAGYNDNFSIAPNGSKLAFVSSHTGSKELFVMDLATLETNQLTNNELIENHTTWSPDGYQIAFTMRSQASDSKEDIYIINVDGSSLSQLTFTPYSEKELAWSLSGKKIAFHGTTANDGDQIYTIDLKDGKFTKITSGTDFRSQPAWIPVNN